MGTEYLSSTKLDPALWGSLQDDLILLIVARLPLKNLVQSQLLSTEWRSHFHSGRFQAEVSRVSSRWPSYAPIFTNERRGNIRGYDRSTQRWETLFSIPPLPFGKQICRAESTFWKCAGSLLAFFHWDIEGVLHIVVTNPITNSSRYLPPLLFEGETFLDPQLGWKNNVDCYPVNRDGYRVAVASSPKLELGQHETVVKLSVYDSASNSWKRRSMPRSLRFHCSANSATSCSFVHLDGVFYWAEVPLNLERMDNDGVSLRAPVNSWYPNCFILYALDLENETYKETGVELPQEKIPDGFVQFVQLVVCEDELTVVVGPPKCPPNESLGEDTKGFIVYTIDPKSISHLHVRLKNISAPGSSGPLAKKIKRSGRGPWPLQDMWSGGILFSDKECIYMNAAVEDLDGRHDVLVFNVRERVWSLLGPRGMEDELKLLPGCELIQSVFEPGLNPFVPA